MPAVNTLYSRSIDEGISLMECTHTNIYSHTFFKMAFSFLKDPAIFRFPGLVQGIEKEKTP